MGIHFNEYIISNLCQLTSIRCEFTFFPFLLQLTFGLGSPVAWQTNETTPPDTPVWSTGTFVNTGFAERQKQQRRGEMQTYQFMSKPKCCVAAANRVPLIAFIVCMCMEKDTSPNLILILHFTAVHTPQLPELCSGVNLYVNAGLR